MTAPTPEQMRELAARNEEVAAEAWRQETNTSSRIALHEASAAALRAAANQLEAVRSAWDSKRVSVALYGVLHTATREDSDE